MGLLSAMADVYFRSAVLDVALVADGEIVARQRVADWRVGGGVARTDLMWESGTMRLRFDEAHLLDQSGGVLGRERFEDENGDPMLVSLPPGASFSHEFVVAATEAI